MSIYGFELKTARAYLQLLVYEVWLFPQHINDTSKWLQKHRICCQTIYKYVLQYLNL